MSWLQHSEPPNRQPYPGQYYGSILCLSQNQGLQPDQKLRNEKIGSAERGRPLCTYFPMMSQFSVHSSSASSRLLKLSTTTRSNSTGTTASTKMRPLRAVCSCSPKENASAMDPLCGGLPRQTREDSGCHDMWSQPWVSGRRSLKATEYLLAWTTWQWHEKGANMAARFNCKCCVLDVVAIIQEFDYQSAKHCALVRSSAVAVPMVCQWAL